MKMMVGIREMNGPTRANVEKVVEVTEPTDGSGIRLAQRIAWQRAALELYRKHFGGSRNATRLNARSYYGTKRPFGTWHVQFHADKNPANLSTTFIVNVDEDYG